MAQAREGGQGAIPRPPRGPSFPRRFRNGPPLLGTWHAGMKSKSLVRLGALAILWGSGFLFIREALGGLSPFQIVFGRLLAAAVAMLALTFTTKRRLPTDRRIWLHLAVMAIITNIAPYFL